MRVSINSKRNLLCWNYQPAMRILIVKKVVVRFIQHNERVLVIYKEIHYNLALALSKSDGC